MNREEPSKVQVQMQIKEHIGTISHYRQRDGEGIRGCMVEFMRRENKHYITIYRSVWFSFFFKEVFGLVKKTVLSIKF